MKRFFLITVLLLTLLPLAATAEGAGGVEVLQLGGQNFLPWAGSSFTPGTGMVTTVGGLGYGVDEDGTVMGGFGLAVRSEGSPSYHAGYGGTIHGWQHRWGPVVGLFTTRVGFGGSYWDQQVGLSLLGTAGAQVGLRLVPWFVIGVEAGLAGTITATADDPFRLAYAPTVGLRFLWGAF